VAEIFQSVQSPADLRFQPERFVAKPLKTVDNNSSARWVGLMSLIFKNIRLSASDLIQLRCPMTSLQDRFWVDVQTIVKALVDINVNVN
jgi:hypothetical protein